MNTKQIEAGKEQGHSALPWAIEDEIIYAENGQQAVAMVREQRTNECPVFEHSIYRKANAQFICKAVNCHDELVELAQMVASSIKLDEIALMDKARAVLAKARGEG